MNPPNKACGAKPSARNPDALALRKFPWQLYVHLTFLPAWSLRDMNDKRFRATLRLVERAHKIPKWSLEWFLALEHSEAGRPHLHGLIYGIPAGRLNGHLLRLVQAAWMKKGGGFASVKLYNPSQDGISYVTKDTGKPENIDQGSPWYSRGVLDFLRVA